MIEIINGIKRELTEAEIKENQVEQLEGKKLSQIKVKEKEIKEIYEALERNDIASIRPKREIMLGKNNKANTILKDTEDYAVKLRGNLKQAKKELEKLEKELEKTLEFKQKSDIIN